ncbi:hypothetical protein F2P81_017203 [Scophthalmus maximus]|uniref:Uncharacterized protein n=1 Tax=Scophthalmus maximus TaxID=52904 RepID=A0A6A4SJF1_SCOMX|nr:hypothetical protein F2P81_017203 [Scophthalmus maximus]
MHTCKNQWRTATDRELLQVCTTKPFTPPAPVLLADINNVMLNTDTCCITYWTAAAAAAAAAAKGALIVKRRQGRELLEHEGRAEGVNRREKKIDGAGISNSSNAMSTNFCFEVKTCFRRL